MWTSEQIKLHKEAAKKLLKIKKLAFDYIAENKNICEKNVQEYITGLMKENNLKTNFSELIIAFGPSSAKPHYRPGEDGNRKIKSGDVIKIDIWAKIDKKGAPYADITWMGFNGQKIPKKTEDIFNHVIIARNKAIQFIKNSLKKELLPRGREIDEIVRKYFRQVGQEHRFIHGTGHSLGFMGPHGSRTRLNMKGKSFLRQNVAYTIEPGIYIEGQFGMRSEIDFYINDNYRLILTAGLQKKIII
ncbi:MAG TPA: M24 family metallopeptidase [Patescibacteria group bacterium]|nr:M24 family metallopeptidase [Patescibacteria group bacterium]